MKVFCNAKQAEIDKRCSDCLCPESSASRSNAVVRCEQTDIKDRNGNMIHFGDKVRFADKVEWYGGEYWADVAFGIKTKEQALKEIAALPYEERLVESVQDYEWLLSSEIQTYWEIVA